MKSFYTALDYEDLLEVSGEDSEKFLQGQLTCDLAHFANDQYGLGALCNNKGRVYSSFRILQHDDSFIMVMQPGVSGVTQTTLQKYIPFYKAEIADARSRFQRAGLCGPLAEEFLAGILPELPAPGHGQRLDEHLVINLGGDSPRFEIWSPSSNGLAALLEESKLPLEPDPVHWQTLDMESGLFFIGPDDVERYTPEEANLDLAGFVSFDKGCYTGQEIVARMHYRGKAGKRLFIIAYEGNPKAIDHNLKDSSGNTLGSVFNTLFFNNITRGFSVLKTSLDLTQSLTLETAEGTLPVTVTAPDYTH